MTWAWFTLLDQQDSIGFHRAGSQSDCTKLNERSSREKLLFFWSRDLLAGCKLTFQKDSVPAQKAKGVQDKFLLYEHLRRTASVLAWLNPLHFSGHEKGLILSILYLYIYIKKG